MPNTELSKQLTVCTLTEQTSNKRQKHRKSYKSAYSKIQLI